MPRKGCNDDRNAAHALLSFCIAGRAPSEQQDKEEGDEDHASAQYPATTCGILCACFCLTIGYMVGTIWLAHKAVTQYVLPSTRLTLMTFGDALVGEGVQCNALNGSPLRLLQCTAISQLSYWWRYTLVGAEQYLRRITNPMDAFNLVCTACVMGRLFLWQTLASVMRIMCYGGRWYLTSCSTVYSTSKRLLWEAQPPKWIEAESCL